MIAKRFSKGLILAVCIVLVFAVAAALLFGNGAGLSANDNVIANTGGGADEIAGASYPVSADGYTHGSNIGRATSGTAINNATELRNALDSGSGTYYLSDSFTGTNAVMNASQSFDTSHTFSGIIYGNGKTVTVTGNQTAWQSVSDGSEIGGLVTKLSGTIYDLNVVLKSGTSAMYKSSDRQIKLGLIAGVIDNGTIENCTVTINSGSMLGAVSTNAASYSNGANCGAVAGQCNSSMTIKNVTVTNNGSIVGAVVEGNGYRIGSGGASMFVGLIWNDNSSYVQKMDNLVTVGNGNVHGWASSMLGYLYTASTAYPITVTNYYNQFTGNYRYGSVSGVQMVSYTLLKWKGSSDSSKVVNYYHSSSTNQGMMSSGYYAAPDNSITVAATEYKVGFDPKQTDTTNSLVVYKSGVTGGENYSAAITTNSGTKYSDKYAFSDDGGTVIFRQLPTAISNWNNGGNFACTINITQNAVEVTPLPAVNKWESSYTTSQSSSGTAVDNGSKLTTAINNNQNIYLTRDITDFRGFTHTETYSGTLDGNGHTIYIVSGAANSADTVGGLFRILSGTIKNVRIVLYSSYNRTVTSGTRGTGIVAGVINGGTVDNVYVYIPSGVTFGVTGSQEGYVGAIAGLSAISTDEKVDGANYTIKNTTVNVDGKMHLDGSYVYLAGFVGKTSTGASAVTAEITNCVFKGNGSFSSSSSESTEPIYLGGTTVLFQKETGNPQSTININGFINAFKGGDTNLTGGYSMYGVLSKNDNGNKMSKWTWNVSGVYDYNSPWGDINKKNTGNDYIDISNYRSTVSTTVDGSSIKVTPYFPAGDTTNLVLVAGDGSQSVPDLAYGDYKSTTDGSYKVVTVPKSAISAGSTVTLAEPVTPATPIADMNKWENGYTTESSTTGTAVSDGAELKTAINDGGDIYLTGDIRDFVGFSHTSTYSGTLDGNGHTIYIVKANAASGSNVGGLFSTLSGTVKNVRIVVMAGVNLSATNYVGGVAGALSEGATVSNVNVIINEGVNIAATASGDNAGGAGGIAGAVINGATTVTISNSTVILNGSLESNAKWTFIGGFVGHLNGGTVNFKDITFKGNGALNGTASGGEGVHTAGAAIIGGGVQAVSLDGMINGFTGTKTANKSAYAITFVRNGSTSATPTFANIYTYGGDFSNEGGMEYGTPVDISSAKSQISATVADTAIPVKAYFPVTNSGELVLVAGDGSSECPFVTYESYEGVKDGNYMVVSVPKAEITASSTVQLIQGKSPVSDPTLATTEEELVYKGGEITIAINQLMSGTTALGESDYTVVITANDGNALVQNGKPVNAGEYTLTVTLLNGYEFEGGTTEKTIEFTVAKKSVTIEGMTATERPYDGTTDVTLTGGTLTGVASADDGIVGFDATGVLSDASAGENKQVNVTAVLNGEKAGNYQLSAQPSVTVTITKASVEVSWGETTSFVYSGLAQAPTATAAGVGQESVNIILTIKNAQSEVVPEGAVNAGNYTAEATTDNGNYTLTNATKEFEITKKAITVGVTVEDWTYGETASVPSVSGNDGQGEVTYLYVGQTNAGTEYSSATAPTDAGTYTLTVSIAQTQNYQAGEATSAQFTVNKKQVERPQADGTSFTYNGLQQTYNPVGYDADTMTVANNQQANADTYQVEVSLKDTYNCEWATEGEQTETFEFTIAKKTLTDNTADVTGTYNATGYSLEIALNGFENGENLSTAGGVVKYGTEEGVYTLDSYSVKDATTAVTVYYQIVFANYVTVVGSGTITVNAKPIEVTWGDLSQSYTGEALKPTATVSQDDIEGDDVVTVSVKTVSDDEEVQAIDVGTYNAVATTQNANYELTNATVDNFVITAADFESAVNIAGWTYGDNANLPTVTYNPGNGAVVYVYNGTANDGTQLSDSQSAPEKAGSYTVTATIAANGNYAEKVVSADFTIAKKTVDVPAVEDKQYDGTLQNSGIVENKYYTVSDAGGKDIGPYTATLTLKDKDNYAWKSGDEDNDGIVEVGYEIVAQDVNINSWTTQPSITGWTYGGYTDENAPVYEAAYGKDTAKVEFRLKSGSDSDYKEVENLSTLGAGVYLMRVSIEAYISPEGGESYTGLSKVVEFTVEKASINVGVAIDGWTYGDEAKTPSVSGNPASGAETRSYEGIDDTVYAASEEVPVNAGTYRVTVTVAETDNYLGGSAYCDFTIAKRDVTATVSAAPATYDGMPHAANVAFEGNLASDVLTATLLYNESDTVPVNAGSYTVTVSSCGGEAVNNYNIKLAEGEVKLVISPKQLTYSDFDVLPEDIGFDGVYDGKPHSVVATVKDGILIGDDTLTVTVLYNDSTEIPVNAGIYELSIAISGNDNYIMGAEDSAELEIYKAKVNIAGANATATYTGEAFGEDAIIEAVFGDADLSLVNVTVTYRQGDSAVDKGDIADVAITLKDEENYEFAAEATTTYTFTVTAGTVRLDGEDKTVEYKGAAYKEDEIKNAIFGEGTWADFVIEVFYNNGAALNAGDIATVRVTGYSDPNYALDPEMTKTYTFKVTTLKVDAPALAQDSFVYNGAEQTVSLTDDTYVAISENVKTDKGDYKAVATLKDKNNYEWTTGGNEDVELPWSISAKEITLKAETSVNKTYDGEAYDFSGYKVSGAEGFFKRDNVTVTVSAGEIYTPGSYGITVSHNANGNYDVAVEPTEAVLTIAKATLIITANPAEKEYTGNDLTFDFYIEGVIGADDVSIDTVTYKKDGAIATPNAIGLYVAEFALKGAHASYYNANSVEVTVKAPTTDHPDDMSADNIILPQGELFYDGQAHNATLDYTSSDGNTYGLVYYFNGSPVENVVNAGTYTVMIYKNSQIYIIEGIEKQLTVLPRVLTADDVSLPQNTTYTYSGAEFGVSVTAKGVNNETVTLASLYDGASEKPVNAGEYAVTFVSSDSNYTVAENVGVTITILKKPFDKPSQPQLTYTGQEQTAFYDTDGYSVGGVFAATDVSVDGYTASFTLKNENYKWRVEDDSVRVVDVVWNISPATVVVTASGADTSKTYDGVALSEKELKALFTAPDKLDDTGKVAVSVTVEGGLEVLNAGEYTVIAVVSDVNYVSEEATVGYTVLKANPVVKAAVKDRLLQDGDKLSVVTVYLQEGSTAGTIAWDDPDTTLVKGDNDVKWTFVPDDGINYNGDSGKIKLVVGDEVLTGLVLTQAPDKTAYNSLDDFDPTGMIVTATFDDQYEQVVTDECEITVENAAEGGKISGATKRVVAEYGNMKVYVAITVTLLTVEIPALDKTETEYNASVQSVTVEENSLYEIVDGNTGVNVGTYKLKLGLTDKVNYVWSDGTSENKELSWKITPVTISGEIVLPDNLVFDGSAKEATFRLVQGTLYGDAQTGISYELPDGTKLGGAPSEAGVYEVVATLPDTVNYRFATDTEYSVSMTIQKRVISITTIGSREKVYDGIEVTEEQLAEFFSATDGIKVNVKVDGTVLDAGTYEITATIDSPNYTAEPVVCTYTVRKASKAISATLNVGYLKLDVSVNGDDTSVEYSLDGNVWAPLDGEIAVGLQEKYTVWVRYGESKNYVEGTPVKLEKNITVEALAQYVEERFEGDATLADVKDIELLERLAAAATGSDAELEARVAELSEQKETLVNGASSAVEKALKIGGRLRGYAGAAASVAVALGGIAIAAALGITVKSRKGGRKNEEK